MIKLLLLTNNQILISNIEEVGADVGEPDCKLTKPFLLDQSNETLSSWLIDFSSQDTFMISSDKIITIAEPSEKLLKKYEDLTK